MKFKRFEVHQKTEDEAEETKSMNLLWWISNSSLQMEPYKIPYAGVSCYVILLWYTNEFPTLICYAQLLTETETSSGADECDRTTRLHVVEVEQRHFPVIPWVIVFLHRQTAQQRFSQSESKITAEFRRKYLLDQRGRGEHIVHERVQRIVWFEIDAVVDGHLPLQECGQHALRISESAPMHVCLLEICEWVTNYLRVDDEDLALRNPNLAVTEFVCVSVSKSRVKWIVVWRK